MTGELSGSGTIEVMGGRGGSNSWPRASGGGGRVAIYYGTLSLPVESIHARGGDYEQRGSAGTIYLKDANATHGDLIIDNMNQISTVGTPLLTNLSAFESIEIRNRGILEVTGFDHPHLLLANLLVDGPDSALISTDRDLDGLRMSVSGDLDLSNGGSIDVSEKGLLGAGEPGNGFGDAGETFAIDGQTVESGSTDGSGGSYGGLGGGPSPNSTYDAPENPRHVGSGGSRSAASTGTGGNGGGRIWIDAATCSLASGTAILASGQDAGSGTGAQGGGSGGAIKLDCLTINGGGDLYAYGGNGAGTDGHGGGGGRIAIRTNNNNWTGTHDVAGGSGTGSRAAGGLGSFFIGDLDPPEVISMTPAPGATFVGQMETIGVIFSESLLAEGLVSNHVLLTGTATGTYVPANLDLSTGDQKLTITYPGFLPQDDYVLVLVSGEQDEGLSDGSVNALDGDFSGVFPSGDGTAGGDFMASFSIDAPPIVTSVTPAPDALDVPEATNVTVVFTEAIIPATVTGASFRLLDDVGSPVPATATVGTSGLRVTLDPDSPLDLNTLYTVEVTSGITDFSGQPAVYFSSLFRTSSTASDTRTLPSASDEAEGLAALSRTGAAVGRAGDLNEDGINDWLAGAPSYQASGGPVEAGSAAVYFGSTVLAERIAADIIFEGAGAHDRAGVSVAGDFDFNGDGHLDFLIGAEQFNRTLDDDSAAGCDAGAPCGAGRVYLIYFDPTDTVELSKYLRSRHPGRDRSGPAGQRPRRRGPRRGFRPARHLGDRAGLSRLPPVDWINAGSRAKTS